MNVVPQEQSAVHRRQVLSSPVLDKTERTKRVRVRNIGPQLHHAGLCFLFTCGDAHWLGSCAAPTDSSYSWTRRARDYGPAPNSSLGIHVTPLTLTDTQLAQIKTAAQ